MDNFGSGGRKKSFIISHSGKFKSKIKKRISITDEIWVGPLECARNKVRSLSTITIHLKSHHGFTSSRHKQTRKRAAAFHLQTEKFIMKLLRASLSTISGSRVIKIFAKQRAIKVKPIMKSLKLQLLYPALSSRIV